MTSEEADRIFIEVWMERLGKEASDLDLHDAEDRAAFRGRVFRAMQHMKYSGVHRVAEYLGAKQIGRSMDAARRAVADAYIKANANANAHHATRKSSVQLDAEIAGFLAGTTPLAGTLDVTKRLLDDASYGPGEDVALVARAKPARELTPTLAATLEKLRVNPDPSMGNISKALAYSKQVRTTKSEHGNLIRLIKGGYVHVCQVDKKPPQGSVALRDSPYGAWHYMLHVGNCGST